jgi:hypothetical protein
MLQSSETFWRVPFKLKILPLGPAENRSEFRHTHFITQWLTQALSQRVNQPKREVYYFPHYLRQIREMTFAAVHCYHVLHLFVTTNNSVS